MAKEKKRKQPADAPPPGEEGDRKGRNEKKPKKEKAAPALPLQIKHKKKHSEVHAKLKREKKAQKRKLARERASELGEQPPERQVPRTIENTREADETVCWPDDQEIKILNPCRKGKKLLVLGIDFTLFDHRSAADNPDELMRPCKATFHCRYYVF